MAKRKVKGRPKIEFDADQVEKLAGYGLTQDQIADWFGASEATLRNRLREDDDLVVAYKRGRAQRLADVTERLADLINEGDRASIFFYLKTQAGWSETQKLEHSGKIDGTPELTVIVKKPDDDGADS